MLLPRMLEDPVTRIDGYILMTAPPLHLYVLFAPKVHLVPLAWQYFPSTGASVPLMLQAIDCVANKARKVIGVEICMVM